MACSYHLVDYDEDCDTCVKEVNRELEMLKKLGINIPKEEMSWDRKIDVLHSHITIDLDDHTATIL